MGTIADRVHRELADVDRVLVLLPGRRSRGRIIISHGMDEGATQSPEA